MLVQCHGGGSVISVVRDSVVEDESVDARIHG